MYPSKVISKIAKKQNKLISVVIPAYRVSREILPLIRSIGNEVGQIIIVDDKCPENSGKIVEKTCKDKRVTIIYNQENLGVGGAVKIGYLYALDSKAKIIVKLDGDGQMDPKLIPKLIGPIVNGKADYTKGNRFFNIEKIKKMPFHRIIGNLFFSFISKFSTGYWNIFDPNNGFTAINSEVLKHIPLDKISDRYFFESDMLFRLNLIRAVIDDIPMDAKYDEEISSLSIAKVAFEFPVKHFRNFIKRIAYSYYLRDFSLASIELAGGIFSLISALLIGIFSYEKAANQNTSMQAGPLVLVAILGISSLQLLLSFFSTDIESTPKSPISQF